MGAARRGAGIDRLGGRAKPARELLEKMKADKNQYVVRRRARVDAVEVNSRLAPSASKGSSLPLARVGASRLV